MTCPRAILLGAAFVLIGCARTDPVPVLPTHRDNATNDALFIGTLGNDDHCLWLVTSSGRRSLVLPQSAAVERRGDGLLIADGDGDAVSTGEEVEVTGGFRPDSKSCLRGGEGAIYVGAILRHT